MTRRTALLICVAALVVAGVGWIAWVRGLTASARLRHAFGVDTSSTESIRAGLLRIVPAGTSDCAIVSFLTRNGFGADLNSRIEREQAEILCAVYTDERAPDAAWEDYHIVFELDGMHALRDVKVTKSILRL